MRVVLIGLLCLLVSSPSMSQTREMLDLETIDAFRIDTRDHFTGAEAGIGTRQVTIPPARHEWQLESAISEALKTQGLLPNADGFGLIYDLNDVETISELIGRTEVVIPGLIDPELLTSGEIIYEITTDSFDKEIFINNYYELKNTLDEISFEIGEIQNDIVLQEINSNYEFLGDIYIGVSQNAIPLAPAFLDQVGHEARILQELTYAAASGELDTRKNLRISGPLVGLEHIRHDGRRQAA